MMIIIPFLILLAFVKTNAQDANTTSDDICITTNNNTFTAHVNLYAGELGKVTFSYFIIYIDRVKREIVVMHR